MNFIFYFHSFKRLIESRLIRYSVCNVTHFRLTKTEISVNNRNAVDEMFLNHQINAMKFEKKTVSKIKQKKLATN